MENENVQPTETETKTYTEEDIQKLIQSETDKVRTEYSKKLNEKEDSSKTYEEKLKELEQKEQELNKKDKLFKVSETLENKGLDKSLSKYLNVDNVEDLDSYIGEIANVLQKHLTDAKINNSYQPSNHTGNKDVISKDDFMKMSYSDRVNLFKSNEELYKRLSK